MNQELKNVLDQILNMSQENRAFIAGQLIDSLDSGKDHDIEAAWEKEIKKRIAEAEKGEAEFISWEDAKVTLMSE